MHQVSKLSHLKILNLACNDIVSMEGLKELKLLTWLSLSNNKIKTMENLNQSVHLEHLDLSGNNIPHISDISYLKNLTVRNLAFIFLNKNRENTYVQYLIYFSFRFYCCTRIASEHFVFANATFRRVFQR